MFRKPRRAVPAVLAAAALVLTACTSSGADPGPPATTTVTVPPSSEAPSTSSAPPKPTAAQLRAKAEKALATIVKNQPSGGVSYAALNVKTGASLSGGAKSGMWTASAYKLFLLETLLYHGGSYSESDAQAAIENSDNAAGYRLFLDAGTQGGMQSAFNAFGMSHTVPGGTDPTFTTTSAPDCIKLLRNLVPGGKLSASQRNYVLGLMRQVEPDQRWGVGAASDKGSDFANKNGWLSIDDSNGPGETDGGLWAVTSLGVITVDGDQVLMAVLTRHQPDMATGVKLVQKIAKTLAPAIA